MPKQQLTEKQKENHMYTDRIKLLLK
jgi:hypothetical protein